MIRVRTQDDIAIIAFDRPDKRNALLPSMLDDLIALVDSTTEARAIVLTGEGKSFCAGFDLDACLQDPCVLDALLTGLARAVHALRQCPRPVVVSAHGSAIAGGCALLCGGDIVVSDRGAKLGYPALAIGISPAVSAPTLASRIGHARARELLLCPEPIDGERAHAIGLVDVLVERPEDALPAAIEQARLLAEPSPLAQIHTGAWIDQLDPALQHTDDATKASQSCVGTSEQITMLGIALQAR